MGFWDSTRIGQYFGAKKDTQIHDDSIVNMEYDVFTLDAFNIGSSGGSCYPKTTDFVKLQEENFILNNVISKIAKKFSNAVFTDETDSALLNKINNPNDSQSKEEFLKEFATFILSSGFTVIWKKWKSFGNFETLEFVNINPFKCSFENDKISFQYENENITTNISDVVVFYDTRREHLNKKGYSRITPLKSQVDNIFLAQKAKNIQINNAGTTIVSPKQVTGGNGIDEGLNAPVPKMGGGLKTQKSEMEDKLNSRGLQNRIIVASKGLDAVNLSEKLNKIDFHKIVEPDALSVYDAFGFPIELSPYGKDATFENKGKAELSLLENEVMPLVNNLTNSLNKEFPKNGNVKANYDQLEVMSIIKNRKIDTNTKLIAMYKDLFDEDLIDAKQYKQILINNNIIDE